MVWKPESNVHYRRRNPFAPGGLHLTGGPHFTDAELAVPQVNRQLREDEYEVKEILDKKHMQEVTEWMPYIRKCRSKNKVPRRAPKKILETVERLKLI